MELNEDVFELNMLKDPTPLSPVKAPSTSLTVQYPVKPRLNIDRYTLSLFNDNIIADDPIDEEYHLNFEELTFTEAYNFYSNAILAFTKYIDYLCTQYIELLWFCMKWATADPDRDNWNSNLVHISQFTEELRRYLLDTVYPFINKKQIDLIEKDSNLLATEINNYVKQFEAHSRQELAQLQETLTNVIETEPSFDYRDNIDRNVIRQIDNIKDNRIERLDGITANHKNTLDQMIIPSNIKDPLQTLKKCIDDKNTQLNTLLTTATTNDDALTASLNLLKTNIDARKNDQCVKESDIPQMLQDRINLKSFGEHPERFNLIQLAIPNYPASTHNAATTAPFNITLMSDVSTQKTYSSNQFVRVFNKICFTVSFSDNSLTHTLYMKLFMTYKNRRIAIQNINAVAGEQTCTSKETFLITEQSEPIQLNIECKLKMTKAAPAGTTVTIDIDTNQSQIILLTM
ncbi:hypothetical protein [Scale drop disease virus]|uniref:Uncharacterized protein n=1 Tax=Scale drop disease virus TaxID=1697349 RepID=A0A7D5ULA2_9VIRU|nr:hypothetical protein [Scale drop disease virus]QXJ13583.1 hypothetical protein PMJGCIOK_00016 [Scale drop disease virus]